MSKRIIAVLMVVAGVAYGSWQGAMATLWTTLEPVGGELWTPADLGDDLVMWLRSSDTDKMSLSGDEIISATNSAPSNPTTVFTELNNTRRPQLVTDYINGYPAIYSYKTARERAFVYSGLSDLNAVAGASAFAVMKIAVLPTANKGVVSYINSVDVGRHRLGMFIGNNQTFAVQATRDDSTEINSLVTSPTGQATINTNSWLFYSATIDYAGREVRMYANGQCVSTNTPPNMTEGAATTDADSLNANTMTYFQSTSNILPGYYSDIITVKRTITAAEVQKLEGWAAHRYSLTSLLPSNHPWKNTPPTK
jgi:hypothetical protein